MSVYDFSVVRGGGQVKFSFSTTDGFDTVSFTTDNGSIMYNCYDLNQADNTYI